MKKTLQKLVLAVGLLLAPLVAKSQDDEADNYIPSTMETLVNDDEGRGVALTEMDKTERRARIANSIFLYEGYGNLDLQQARRQSFLGRYMYNLEDELNDANYFRFFDSEDEIVWDDLRFFLFEREAYSALGKTLIEKYKLARDIDRGIKKLRDATTVSLQSKSGVKYRMGLFVGKSEIGEVGAFLKIKNGCFNTVFSACQNELEAYVEKKFNKVSVRAGYEYDTGINDDPVEGKVYISLKGKRF